MLAFQTCEIDASVENFGGGCGSSYKYTCTAQEFDYPNCTLHDPLSGTQCNGVDLSQDIGVRCQTREETSMVVNDEPTTLGMMSTGPISEDHSTSAGPISEDHSTSAGPISEDQGSSTGSISDNKTTASTTRLVMMTNTTENQIATEASLICPNEALGTITGLLTAALVVVTMGWIVSCVYWQRRARQR